MKCPKCGFVQPYGETECLKCGIVIGKYLSKQQQISIASEVNSPELGRLIGR